MTMKVEINKIKVAERVRKEVTKISELAADITENGLFNAVTIMPLKDDEYQLLAGLRRLRAVQSLGWTEIEVNSISPKDAEAMLRIEISENEQREPFTYSEKMDYARLFVEIEKAKALERKSIGGKGGFTATVENEDVDCSPHLPQGKSRDAIGARIGMSGKQYDRAKYIANNAPPAVIEELDKGERTIRGTYDELKAKEKTANLPPPELPKKSSAATTSPTSEVAKKTSVTVAPPTRTNVKRDVSPKMEKLHEQETERIRKLREYEALPSEGKIAELQRQIEEQRVRAVRAESELEDFKYKTHNQIYHRDCNLENLQKRNNEPNIALTAANARIAELETMLNT
ncbi:hypothetical protein FACS1894133_4500 [Clostridia bacterium]|nr:hypothetical protein FACS1894133_4500 [Clostridia bacterium]